MSYLYGDLTPFPHDTNFIELIRDGTEMCRAVLQAEATIERLREQTDMEKLSVARSLEELRQLATDIAEVLRPYRARTDSVVQEITGRLVQTLRSVIEGAQSSLQGRRDSTLSQMDSKVAAERALALPALEKFLVRHELPQTVWRIRWISAAVESQVAEVKAWATAPFGLETTFEIDVPPTSPWLRTIKIGDVKQNVAVELPKKARHGTVLKKHELDRYFVTEALLGRELTRLTARKTIRVGSPGLELSWRGGDLSIMPVDDDTLALGPLTPDPRDMLILSGLRQAVEAHLWALLDRRVRLAEAKLGNSDIQQLDSPSTLARVLIRSIAPICREIIMRTAVRGELSLKRVVEDGRREEIFIRAGELTKIFTSLPPKQRAYFDELGLPASPIGGPPTVSGTVPAAPPRMTAPTGPMLPFQADEDIGPLIEPEDHEDLEANVIVAMPTEDESEDPHDPSFGGPH